MWNMQGVLSWSTVTSLTLEILTIWYSDLVKVSQQRQIASNFIRLSKTCFCFCPCPFENVWYLEQHRKYCYSWEPLFILFVCKIKSVTNRKGNNGEWLMKLFLIGIFVVLPLCGSLLQLPVVEGRLYSRMKNQGKFYGQGIIWKEDLERWVRFTP